jgi:hypothetical protein
VFSDFDRGEREAKQAMVLFPFYFGTRRECGRRVKLRIESERITIYTLRAKQERPEHEAAFHFFDPPAVVAASHVPFDAFEVPEAHRSIGSCWLCFERHGGSVLVHGIESSLFRSERRDYT